MKDKKRVDLEKLIISNKPIICEVCKGKLFYVGGGKYQCESCGFEVFDDFGKVKHFLEEYGPSPAVVVSEATGVSTEIIEMFLKQGRVEIPENSPYYINCEKCGCSIRYGRFCPQCVKELSGGIYAILSQDMGERPKHDPKLNGQMRFINKKNTKK